MKGVLAVIGEAVVEGFIAADEAENVFADLF